MAKQNEYGLTFHDWLSGAGFGRSKEASRVAKLKKAWLDGEDVSDWRVAIDEHGVDKVLGSLKTKTQKPQTTEQVRAKAIRELRALRKARPKTFGDADYQKKVAAQRKTESDQKAIEKNFDRTIAAPSIRMMDMLSKKFGSRVPPSFVQRCEHLYSELEDMLIQWTRAPNTKDSLAAYRKKFNALKKKFAAL